MFSVELCLVKQAVLSWFNKKIKSQHLEIDLSRKNKHEKDHLINWNSDKCLICNFPLKIYATGPDVPNNEMPYGDFYIRYKHRFLRNIYSKKKAWKSSANQNIPRILQNISKIY